MTINFDTNFWSNALANAFGTIIAAFILWVIGLFTSDKLRQWVYKNNPRFTKFWLRILDFVTKPILGIILFFIFQILLFLDIYRVFSIIATTSILLRFYFWPGEKTKTYPSKSSKFFDEFEKDININKNWETVTGTASLNKEEGKPKPALNLSMADKSTNTFLLLKNIREYKGEIECDFYLEKDGLLNFVILCDKDNERWHMARFDSRSGTSDGILIKENKDSNWRADNMSSSRTSPDTWHKAKIEFGKDKIKMFKDGDLVAEVTNPEAFGDYIGIFNECNSVIVDNFKFSES